MLEGCSLPAGSVRFLLLSPTTPSRPLPSVLPHGLRDSPVLCSLPFNRRGHSRSYSMGPAAGTPDRGGCLSTSPQGFCPSTVMRGQKTPETRLVRCQHAFEEARSPPDLELLSSQMRSLLVSLFRRCRELSAPRCLMPASALSYFVRPTRLENRAPGSAECLLQCLLQACLWASRVIKPGQSPSPLPSLPPLLAGDGLWELALRVPPGRGVSGWRAGGGTCRLWALQAPSSASPGRAATVCVFACVCVSLHVSYACVP